MTHPASPSTKAPELSQDSEVRGKTAADRFRQARSLLPLSRRAFCDKHNLNYNTVQSWEISRTSSREGNVTKFCEALAEEGIVCTEDWLMEGIGPAPFLSTPEARTLYAPALTPRSLKSKPTDPLAALAQKEAAFFQNCYEEKGFDVVTVHLLDDSMHPDYEKGDYVGAGRVSLEAADHLTQTICLIETEPHHFLVRRLLKEGDKFILLASHKAYPVLCLDSITSVAEILWRCKSAPSLPLLKR